MSKKLITACMSLVAFAALALPAMALAGPPTIGETDAGNVFTPLSVPNNVTATNVGNAKFFVGTEVISECSKVVITGDLLKNNDTEGIEATITTATFEGTGAVANGMKECTGAPVIGSLTPTTNGGGVDGENVAGGTPWCIKNVAGKDEFTVRGGACPEKARAINFILDTTSAGQCTYTRAAAITGTFVTDKTGSEDAVLTVNPTAAGSEFTKSAGGVLCPAKGSLEMAFTLETDSPTVTPLYIKES